MEAIDKRALAQLEKKSEEASTFLKLLAHPQRLIILCTLMNGPKSVGELEEACGASQSAVSQFLKLMKEEGLVSCERSGHFVNYKIQDERVLKVIGALYTTFCVRGE